ncbi:hypothetical protein [Ramlibacter sp.]|uniref:hypothetical protein n=1 Tax=Ramlibacter sp. TaxID=1917967 RepID=UPI0035AFB919
MRHCLPTALSLAVALLLATAPAAAQERPAFRCMQNGKPVYTHTPCEGGRQVTPKPRKAASSARHVKPPQDRAKAARRAQLTPEARKECEGLEVTIPQLEDGVKAQGPNVKPEDERSLTEAKKKYREMKCR